MKHDALSRLALAGLLVFANTCMAQISISTGAEDVQIGGDGSIRIKNGGNKMATHDNKVSTTVGGIAEDANIEGITIINNRVSIDGKEIPPNITRYKSPKTGKVYLIQRKGGSVNVSEAGGGK